MRRATITLPPDLAAEVEAYLGSQEPRPSLTSLVQTALRRYLTERRLADRQFAPPTRQFQPLVAERGSGLRDVSAAHDRFLAEGG